jgi:hypothetical protein
MSNHNNRGNNGGKTPQPNATPAPQPNAAQTNAAPHPGEAKFRQETAEAMENDLMSVGALAPDSVAVKLPPASVPKIVDDSAANSGQEQGQTQAATQPAAVPGSTQILSMLHEGKIDVAEAERLLCALKAVAPTAPPAIPYIGGADGPATRAEIMEAVQQTYGAEIQSRTRDKVEMMEVMGAMVEKIVRSLREPSEEEKLALERRKRDRTRTIQEQLETIKQQHEFKQMCPHERATADGKSHTCISALHNYIDGVLRGICSLCDDIMAPGHPSYKQVIMQHNLAVSN